MDVGGDLRSTRSTRDSSTTLVPIWSPLLRKTSQGVRTASFLNPGGRIWEIGSLVRQH